MKFLIICGNKRNYVYGRLLNPSRIYCRHQKYVIILWKFLHRL